MSNLKINKNIVKKLESNNDKKNQKGSTKWRQIEKIERVLEKRGYKLFKSEGLFYIELDEKIIEIGSKIFYGALRKLLMKELRIFPDTKDLKTLVSYFSYKCDDEGKEVDIKIRSGNDSYKEIIIDYSTKNKTNYLRIKEKEMFFSKESGILKFACLDSNLPPTEPTECSFEEGYNLFKCHFNLIEEDLICLIGWLCCVLGNITPNYILAVCGEFGSAKTTLVKKVKFLVDPSTMPLLSQPTKIDEYSLQAKNSYLLAYDNISTIKPIESDLYCKLVTGATFQKRELYSTSDMYSLNLTRNLILNGIGDFLLKEDLIDRCIVISPELLDLGTRKTTTEVMESFKKDLPKMMGFLFSLIQKGITNYPDTILFKTPRMADSAKWATACLNGSSIEKVGDFSELVINKRNQVCLNRVFDGSGKEAIVTYLDEQLKDCSIFQVNPTEMMQKINQDGHRFFNNTNALGRCLTIIAPSLRLIGISFCREKSSGSNSVNFYRFIKEKVI